MDDREVKIEKLKEYFQKRADVVMAFLFGSQVKGYARAASDWDIGVYLTEEARPREQEIWAAVEHITGTEVDLVILNRAPASIAWTILRAGIPLAIKNRRIYLRFLLTASREANDWYRTSQEYHRIFERSASLTQEDRERLERTLQFMEQEIADFDRFRQLTWQEYDHDRAKKREVERWTEQLINAVIDAAQIILASERHVIPETYRAMVRSLGATPPFNQNDACEKLSAWTEFRNMLAHEYLDYRWKELSIFIRDTEPLFRMIISDIQKFLTRSASAES